MPCSVPMTNWLTKDRCMWLRALVLQVLQGPQTRTLRTVCRWPCVFYPTTRGCLRGDRCAYCHFNHPITMLERRVRKRTRDKIKRKLSEILNPPVDLATWLIVDTFSRSRLRLVLFLSLSLSLHSFVVKLLLST